MNNAKFNLIYCRLLYNSTIVLQDSHISLIRAMYFQGVNDAIYMGNSVTQLPADVFNFGFAETCEYKIHAGIKFFF